MVIRDDVTYKEKGKGVHKLSRTVTSWAIITASSFYLPTLLEKNTKRTRTVWLDVDVKFELRDGCVDWKLIYTLTDFNSIWNIYFMAPTNITTPDDILLAIPHSSLQDWFSPPEYTVYLYNPLLYFTRILLYMQIIINKIDWHMLRNRILIGLNYAYINYYNLYYYFCGGWHRPWTEVFHSNLCPNHAGSFWLQVLMTESIQPVQFTSRAALIMAEITNCCMQIK